MFRLLKKGHASRLKGLAKQLHSVGSVSRVNIDGIEVAYWRAVGGEKTVLLVHGNSACKEVFHHQVKLLQSHGFSAVAIDLPGHGSSSDAANPDSQYTIPGYALVIKKLLEKLSVEKPLVVGWSLGGHIAIEMAGRGFDLAGVLIVGTPPAGPGAVELEQALLPSPIASVTMSEDAPEDAVRLYTENLYGVLDPIPELFIQAGLRTDGRARRIMGQHWGSGDEGCHQKTVVAGSHIPFCVLHGLDDPFISRPYFENVSWRHQWHEKVIDLPNVGHAAFIEDPDRFNEILLEFAREVLS